MPGILLLLLAGLVRSNSTLDKRGHLMYVEYSINEPAKIEGVVFVDIVFHYKGRTYIVALHRQVSWTCRNLP